MAKAWYWFVRNLVRYAFFKGTGGLRVKGKKNVPRTGPLIVAPNHVSHLDPPVIACSLPRMVTFMAKEELFKSKLFGGLIRSLRAFPVKRGEGDTEAIRKAVQFLEEGHALLIFPEGTRGDGKTMLPVNRGVVMLAKRTGAQVLPIGIVGTHKKWPRGKSKPKWGRVTVSFGKPFTYAEIATDESEKVNREVFAQELERRIFELCNAEGMGLRTAESGSQLEASDPGETAPAKQAPEAVEAPHQS